MALLLRFAKGPDADRAWYERAERRLSEAMRKAFDAYRADVARAVERNPTKPDLTDANAALDRAWREAMAEAFQAGGERALGAIDKDTAFSVDNPYARKWLEDKAAEYLTNVTEETRAAVAEQVKRALAENRTTAQVRRDVKPLIGLLPQHAQAVANLRERLEDEGAPNVDAQVDRYADRLLSYRANTIARTETVRALNAGTQSAWEQAAGEGFLDADTMQREWIAGAGERTCPICSELDGQRVGLNEPFISSIVGEVDLPPVHVLCRCSTGLVRRE